MKYKVLTYYSDLAQTQENNDFVANFLKRASKVIEDEINEDENNNENDTIEDEIKNKLTIKLPDNSIIQKPQIVLKRIKVIDNFFNEELELNA